jgi:ribonuclease HI
MKKITIYTDGACRGNGKENALGGYGIVLIDYENKKKKEVKYARRGVTNNIMELGSVIEALKILKEPCEVQIYSDSKYVVDAFNQKWIFGWRRNNWKKSDKSPVKNQELWQELWHLTQKHDCTFNWVKGHNDNKWNERCDELANIAMDELLASEK